jgi:hypothetical protein
MILMKFQMRSKTRGFGSAGQKERARTDAQHQLFFAIWPFSSFFPHLCPWQFHFKKWTLSSAPSSLAPSLCVPAPILLTPDNLTWQPTCQGVGAIDLGADLLASAPPPPRLQNSYQGVGAKIYGAAPLFSEPPEFQPKFSNRAVGLLSLCPSRRRRSPTPAPTGVCAPPLLHGGRAHRSPSAPPLLHGGRDHRRPPAPPPARRRRAVPPRPSPGKRPAPFQPRPPAHTAKAAAPTSSPGRAPSPPAHQAGDTRPAPEPAPRPRPYTGRRHAAPPRSPLPARVVVVQPRPRPRPLR